MNAGRPWSRRRRWLVASLLAAGLGMAGLASCVSFGPPSTEEAFPPGVAPQRVLYELPSGGSLATRQIGRPGGPLVVFVHGTPGSWNDFAFVMADAALAERAWMVSVDRPGWGGSSAAGLAPDLEAQVRALAPVLDAFPQQLPAILVGHSYGGPVAALAAAERPRQVGGLVLVAGSIDPELEESTWYQKLGRTRLVRWMVPEVLVQADREIVDLRAQLEAMLPRWSEIEAPTVVIQGEEDGLVPAANADFAERRLTAAPLTVQRVPGVGHLIPWYHPQLIRDALLGLLEERREDAESTAEGEGQAPASRRDRSEKP